MDELIKLRKKISELEGNERLYKETEKKLQAAIQQLQASERELKSNQLTLKQTQIIARIGSWEWDVASDIVTWSDELFQIFRLNPENGAVSYADHPKIYTPESMNRLDTAVRHTLETGEPYEIDLEIIRGDETNAYCTARGFAKKDENGKVIGLYGSFQDITERKQMEEELLKNQIRYQKAQAIGHVGNWEYDPIATTFWASDEAKRIYGFNLDTVDFSTEMVENCIPERERVHQALVDLLEHNEEYNLVFDIITNDKGIRKTIHSVAEVERDALGNPLKITGVINDITLQKKTEEHLKALNQQLLANEQQLKAAVQQLQASEQQLKAAVQQLQANEQQLKAANQQLEASEKELVETNKKLQLAKEEVERSEKYLENIIKNIADPIFVKDEDSRLLLVNDAFCQLFGLNKENIIGKTLAEDVTPAERESFFRIDKMVLNTGEENFNEESITVRGGSAKIIATKKSRFIDEKGRKFLIGIIRDITERKQFEIELINAKKKTEESVERFNLAMKASNDGLFDWNLETNEIYYSPGWKKMLGYEDHEIPNDFSIWENTTAPDDVKKSWEMQQKLISKQIDRFVMEFKMKHKHGHWVDVLSRAEAIFNDDGKAVRIVGTHVDISERKKIESELIAAKEKAQESEEKYRALYENAPLSYQSLNEDGSFNDVNPAWLSTLGYTREEVIGKYYKDFLHPEWEDHFEKNFPAFKKRGYVNDVHYKIRHKKGHYLDISFEGCIGYNPDGSFKQTYCVFQDITERKQLEIELIKAKEKAEESSEQLKRISDNIVDGMIYQVAMPDENKRKFNYVSDAVTRLYGCTPEQAIENPDLIYGKIHPEDVNELINIEKEALKNMTVFRTECRLINPDGSVRWSYFISQPRIINGIVCWDGIEVDITRQKENEHALLESSQVTEGIMNSIETRVFWKDMNLVYLGCNKIFAQDAGFSDPKDIIGKDDYAMGWRAQAELYRANDKRVINSGLPQYQIEEPQTTPDGKLLTLLTSKIPLKNSKGEIYGVLGTYTDITERKQAEVLLRESEERFKALHNASFGGISIHDKGIIMECNHGLSIITGYSYDELIGMDGLLLIAPDYRELVRNNINSGFEEPYEAFGLRKDGEIYPMRLEARNIPYKGKSVRAVEFRDTTEQKMSEYELTKAMEKATESDRLKSAFLANMSHEIRTPMNGILGFTNLLQNPNLDGEEQQRYIEIIKKSGDRMLSTVNDIINISKIEAGMVEISVSEVDINEILEDLHSFFKPEAAKKGIQFVYKQDFEEPDSRILTDHEKFNSIVTNLIKNAIKYTNEGLVEFGYNIKKDSGFAELEFYVKDTGSGIKKNRQHAIFDRFVQADIEDKRALQGSGLGLAISKAYTEMLGGKIWVESEEGKGSTFYFTIEYNSVSESKSNPKTDATALNGNGANRKLKILVVEDDETSQHLISIMVNKFAKEIINVSSSREAIEACQNNADIDLILMDIQLPDMNGYDTTRQIRIFNKDVVILAQTAYALTGDKEKAISAGCNDYISKPINNAELISLIQKHIKK